MKLTSVIFTKVLIFKTIIEGFFFYEWEQI